MSWWVHAPTNGVPLLSTRESAKAVEFHIGLHQAGHPALNRAQKAVAERILESMEAGIDAAVKANDLAGAMRAVRQAELQMSKMRDLTKAAVWNANPGAIMPLHVASNPNALLALERRWTRYLTGAVE